MRALVFGLLCAVFSPLLLVGLVVFAFKVRFVNMPRGISGTAYEPYMARLVLHLIGSRRDDVSERIAPHLPALSPLIMRLLVKPMALASRWSGFGAHSSLIRVRTSAFRPPRPRASRRWRSSKAAAWKWRASSRSAASRVVARRSAV